MHRFITSLALLLLVAASARSAEPTLHSLGADFQRLLEGDADGATDSLASMRVLLAQLDEVDEAQWKGSRHQLDGAMLLALSRYDEAADRFKDARKEYKDEAYQDDAEFLRILAMERGGKDAEAADAWKSWQKSYGSESPLRGDAMLLRLWNSLRRGDLKLARELVTKGAEQAPWMLGDSRWLIAAATLELKQSNPETALALLDRGAEGPDALYLRGLALLVQGNTLKSAAAFQQVASQHPESIVRDYALLAKADVFLQSKVYRSAIEEFQRVLDLATDPQVRAEASLRHAAAVLMDGEIEASAELLRSVAQKNVESDVGARAQFLLAESLVAQELYEEAIIEYNVILTLHFQHSVAASAQYRVGRCLDALGRPLDATGAYQAVVAGYPLEPEAPAAAYLAGAGLLEQGDHLGAASYFQIVVDRYTTKEDADGGIVFLTPQHQELTEAALCLLALSYHRAGRLGQLSGAIHLMLQRMPKSNSPWRAWTLLIDADALAAQGRHKEAQAELEALFAAFPEHPATLPANQLLAWNFAQQGEDDKAIAVEERMLRSYASSGDPAQLAASHLHIAHVRFNQRRYEEAAKEYEAYLQLEDESSKKLLPLYQLGLCYQRLGRSGDSVDRWERLVALRPDAEISEKAWSRAGDLYFSAGHYEDAARCYEGLLEHFAGSSAAATGMLRLAQCAYNAGEDDLAIDRYSDLIDRYPTSEEGDQARKGLELALYRMGQSSEGVDALGQLVERYPTSSFAADAQFQIASLLYEKGDHARAAEEFRRVVSQFPDYVNVADAQLLAAESYAEAGQLDEARSGYEQFVILFGDHEEARTAHFRLGSMYFEQEDYMRTALEFSQVLESEEKDELAKAALFNLAVCQQLIGDAEAAVGSFRKYRDWFGDSDDRALDVALSLAQLHRSRAEGDDALAEYAKVLKTKPDAALRVEVQYEIAGLQEELGNEDAALEAYEAAMKIGDKANPFRLSAVARCAAIYETKEQYKKALSAYRDLARNSEDPNLRTAAKQRADELATFAR